MPRPTGARRPGAKSGETAPDAGDLIWINFTPQAGREQAGRRPALVLSPRNYNAKIGLCIACPVTSQAKGYPFEVALPTGLLIEGVVLADHLKNLDWRERQAKRIAKAPPAVLDEVRARIRPLLGL
jgi:mRNA interferase MazF